ncbi:hypothetical protein BJ170DRAFT_608549 [Xylariales sp. AK1849]|nr:hypothetical protein BJ170DRAFT_608549 [Xylariales sp. AK1849]
MSSSMLSPPNAAAQRVPAWKRLGLKLKGASETRIESPAPLHTSVPSSASTSSVSVAKDNYSALSKRKPSGTLTSDQPSKKPRKGNLTTPTTQSQQSKTPKSVSFASKPEVLSSPTPATNGKKAANKLKQNSTVPKDPLEPKSKKQSAVNLQPAIDYLRQWHSARDQWKFNKNCQSKLLENVFANETTIPAVDINIFYEYIKPLKGFVRKRLRETAAEVRNMDIDQGSEGFSSSSKEVAQKKQQEYEDIIVGYLKEGRTPDKRRFEEIDYVLRTADMEMQRRVVKRMRAEMVLEELSDSDDSETTASTTMTTGMETENETQQGPSKGAPGENDGDKRVKLNDGSQRRIRRDKVRTAVVDDEETSSSSDSESESETSGSGSSLEDSDDDAEMELNPEQNEAETSSSSSSSSSGSEADSNEESSEEEDED